MNLLRRNDAAQRVPTRQHDAAMIDFGGQPAGVRFSQALPFNQRATASRAPIGLCLFGQNRVALAADSFHNSKLIESGRSTCVPFVDKGLIPGSLGPSVAVLDTLNLCTQPRASSQSIWMAHCCRRIPRRSASAMRRRCERRRRRGSRWPLPRAAGRRTRCRYS